MFASCHATQPHSIPRRASARWRYERCMHDPTFARTWLAMAPPLGLETSRLEATEWTAPATTLQTPGAAASPAAARGSRRPRAAPRRPNARPRYRSQRVAEWRAAAQAAAAGRPRRSAALAQPAQPCQLSLSSAPRCAQSAHARPHRRSIGHTVSDERAGRAKSTTLRPHGRAEAHARGGAKFELRLGVSWPCRHAASTERASCLPFASLVRPVPPSWRKQARGAAQRPPRARKTCERLGLSCTRGGVHRAPRRQALRHWPRATGRRTLAHSRSRP